MPERFCAVELLRQQAVFLCPFLNIYCCYRTKNASYCTIIPKMLHNSHRTIQRKVALCFKKTMNSSSKIGGLIGGLLGFISSPGHIVEVILFGLAGVFFGEFAKTGATWLIKKIRGK